MGRRGRANLESEAQTYFVTTTVMNFDSIFASGEQYYFILRDSLSYVIAEHHASLLAYVFMPNHLHLVLHLPQGERLSDMMRDFKKFTSTKIRQQLESDGHTTIVERLRSYAEGKKKQIFKLWMERFDDVVLFTEKMLRTKIEYIHNNPVKKGFVEKAEDWKFSSARNYMYNDHSILKVTTEW